MLMDGKMFDEPSNVYYWETIKKNIDPEKSYSLYDSDAFYKWLMDYDLDQLKKDSFRNTVVKDVLMWVTSILPRGTREALRTVYNRNKIN